MARANRRDELHDQILANLSNRVHTERDRLRRTLSGEPEAEPQQRVEKGPRIDLAPRIRARRKGTGRLFQIFRAWADEPPEV